MLSGAADPPVVGPSSNFSHGGGSYRQPQGGGQGDVPQGGTAAARRARQETGECLILDVAETLGHDDGLRLGPLPQVLLQTIN